MKLNYNSHSLWAKTKFAAGAVMLVAASLDASAVRARQDVFRYGQPDGSAVSVWLCGDENLHYYMTADGLPLVEDAAGTLYFAAMKYGKAVSSGIKACDPALRPAGLKPLSAAESEMMIGSMLEGRRRNPALRVVPQQGMGRFETTFPTQGKVKALVILVEYADVKFQTADPGRYFSDLLNKDGFSEYGATGSAREYFLDSSNGLFDLNCDVYGPVTLPQKRSYYGSNNAFGSDSQPEDMVVHAVEILDPEVDFSLYDCDKDGILDNVFIFYAGQGEASGGPASSVWPHAWELRQAGKSFTVDGVLVDHYACTNEIQNGKPDGIGTFCHEFSHIMGLPDLYDTMGLGCKTPGAWSVMDYGPYNNNSRTPPSYSAFERNAMGWLDIVHVDEACDVTLDDIKGSNKAVLIATSRKKEFYLFENRQQTSWDTYLPGHGMLIWHVDFDEAVWRKNSVNNDSDHQYVDLVEACGEYGGENEYSWPGTSSATSFTSLTTPAFIDWNRKPIDLPVTDIEEKDGRITFKVDGGDFEIGVPGNLAVSECTPISARVSWGGVDRAKEYRLSAWSQTGPAPEYVDGFRDRRLSPDKLSAEVPGLLADTEYTFELRAVAGSRVSAPAAVKVSTPSMTFPYMTPEALPASDVDTQGFTARWVELPGAIDYRISVDGVIDKGEQTARCDFGSLIFRVPPGWEYSLKTSKYTDPEWCGAASPAAKIDKDGATLTSPDFEDDVESVSFWCRITSEGKGSHLILEGLSGSEWIQLHDYELNYSKGQVYVFDEVPEGIRKVRLRFVREKTGNLALDDVVVKAGGLKRFALDGYADKVTGNVTSCRVEGIPSGLTGLYYKVKGISAAGESSLYSREQYVGIESSVKPVCMTTEQLSVAREGFLLTCRAAEGVTVTLFDITGNVIGSQRTGTDGIATLRLPDVNGVYIVRAVSPDGHSVSSRILVR